MNPEHKAFLQSIYKDEDLLKELIIKCYPSNVAGQILIKQKIDTLIENLEIPTDQSTVKLLDSMMAIVNMRYQNLLVRDKGNGNGYNRIPTQTIFKNNILPGIDSVKLYLN